MTADSNCRMHGLSSVNRYMVSSIQYMSPSSDLFQTPSSVLLTAVTIFLSKLS